jgi:hypothetical protein
LENEELGTILLSRFPDIISKILESTSRPYRSLLGFKGQNLEPFTVPILDKCLQDVWISRLTEVQYFLEEIGPHLSNNLSQRLNHPFTQYVCSLFMPSVLVDAFRNVESAKMVASLLITNDMDQFYTNFNVIIQQASNTHLIPLGSFYNQLLSYHKTNINKVIEPHLKSLFQKMLHSPSLVLDYKRFHNIFLYPSIKTTCVELLDTSKNISLQYLVLFHIYVTHRQLSPGTIIYIYIYKQVI